MDNKCNVCKNLKESVYMVLENETLYNYYCEVGNVLDEVCNSFLSKDDLNKTEK